MCDKASISCGGDAMQHTWFDARMTDEDHSVFNDESWRTIRETVARAKQSSMHCAIASVDPDGTPHITPVGTVFLRDDRTGFYFDQYTSALARNIEADPRVCLMAVDTGRLFWLRSLLAGRFIAPQAYACSALPAPCGLQPSSSWSKLDEVSAKRSG
ncbi:pyridoxamine 5'-phosphate oxidase family protein [Mycobacterium sp.]|uniref:pyridoxamine 5'-phosphate oxidase family protein n=1 Tax=Mycobacterium sp. TaxID=1785 RepID=UPI003BABC051